LGASVRSFNDLAVPGLGSVCYGKQLLLAGCTRPQFAKEGAERENNQLYGCLIKTGRTLKQNRLQKGFAGKQQR